MTKQSLPIRFPLLLLVVCVICGCGLIGFQRLTIDTDVIHSLPAHEPEITEALTILRSHPLYAQA